MQPAHCLAQLRLTQTVVCGSDMTTGLHTGDKSDRTSRDSTQCLPEASLPLMQPEQCSLSYD